MIFMDEFDFSACAVQQITAPVLTANSIYLFNRRLSDQALYVADFNERRHNELKAAGGNALFNLPGYFKEKRGQTAYFAFAAAG